MMSLATTRRGVGSAPSSSRTAPARTSARQAVGAFRRGVLTTLAFILFLCGLIPTAQAALDNSDWTLTPTRGGVKIAIHLSGKFTVSTYFVERKAGSRKIAVLVRNDDNPFVVFDTSAPVGGSVTYELTTFGAQNFAMNKTVRPITLAVPDRPTNFSATTTRRAGQVTLSWYDPSDPSIQRYEYRQKSAGGDYPEDWTAIANSGDTTTSYVVTGLTNGITYTFQMRAVNTQGGSTESVDQTATPQAPPSRPKALKLTVGDTQLEVSWGKSVANGAPITRYGVEYKLSATDTWINSNTGTNMNRKATIAGLTNGQRYDVQVQATNSIGGSPWASASAAPGPPAKVTGVKAIPGTDYVRITWDTPAVAPTGYQLRYRKVGDRDSWIMITSGIKGTEHNVYLLENGRRYQFYVRAMNQHIEGPWSKKINTGPPQKPGLVITAKPNEFSQAGRGIVVTFTFTEPVTGFDLKDIQVYNGIKPGSLTAHPGGQVYSGTFRTGTMSGSMWIATNKDRVSTTGGQTGPGLVVGLWVNYVAAPPKPWSYYAVSGDEKATVFWSDPDDPAITEWQVQSWPARGRKSDWQVVPGGAAAGFHEFSSLVNGRSYRFKIRQMQGSVERKVSSWISTTPVSALLPRIQEFTAARGDSQINLSWTSPNDNTITKWQYRLHFLYGATAKYLSTDWIDIPGSGAGTTSYTVPNIPNNKGYGVQIRAMHGSAVGPPTIRKDVIPNPSTTPAKPAGFMVTAGDGQAVLDWTNPGDASITRWWYRIQDNRLWLAIPNSNASTVSYTVPNLTNGSDYRFRIVAENSDGKGVPTDWVRAYPYATSMTPAPPAGLTATPGAARVTLSWDDPGDSSITTWQYLRSYGDGWSKWRDVIGSDAGTTSVTVMGLPAGIARAFLVRARNARGAGGSSRVVGTPNSDGVPPTVHFTPASGTTSVPGTDVVVTFNEPVHNQDDTTITNTNAHAVVELRKDGTGPDLAISGRVSINRAKTVITIDPASDLAAGNYTVKVPANTVKDWYGNVLDSDRSATFTIPVVDTTAPTVTFTPADGDKTGNQDVNVKVEFNEAVRQVGGATFDDAAVAAAVMLQKDGAGTDLAGVGQVTINGALKVITINPASALAPGSYTVKLLANQVEDEQGNAITTEQSAVFEVDTAAPTVTFTPADGDKTGNQDVNVKVEFNEAVRQVGGATFDDAAVAAAVMLQKDGTGTDLAGVGQVTINGALKVITINPASALAPGSYTVKLLANQVEDEQGNAITTEQSAVFEVDTAAPTVTFTPADGDKTGNQDVNVKVEFNEAVRQVGGDPITDSNAHLLVMLQKDGTGTDLAGVGQVTINGALKVITINPASALAPGSYTVKLLANQVEDEQGNAITTEQSAVFEVDTAAPTVTFTPADGDKTGNQDVNVKVEFNEAVRQVGGDPITDSNAHLLVMLQKDGTGTDLAGVGQVTINGALKVITINPASALAPGSYTVKLLANQVEDEQGNAITTEQSAVFEVDTAAPTVTFTPADGDKTGNQDVNVKVEFNEAVRQVGGATFDDAAVAAAVMLQKDGAGTDLAGVGQVTINGALKVITINPASALAPGSYTVKLLANQVEDEQGNAITTEQSAVFEVDTAAPTVTFTPADGDKTGNQDVNVKVEFNEAVRQVGGDPITDSNAHLLVMLQKDGTGTDLAGVGQVTINGALKVITINPASALAPGSYTVKLLANQVEDEQGNAITTEQSAVFEVDTAAPTVTFTPADGDKTGNQDVNVKVEFNEAVRQVGGDPITDSNAHLLVMLQKDGTGTDLAGVGQVTINGALKVITINPASALAPGSYTVKLLANQVEDEQGNAITTEQSAVFEVDTALPVVTFSPADGDKTGNQDVNVKVEFNEAVRQVGGDPITDSNAHLLVMLQKDGTGTDLAGVGQVTINGALKVITINPASALAPGSYTVKLLANQVEDEQGNAITTEQSAVFEVDTAAPTVTFTPADGDKTGNQDVNVKVEFNEAVRQVGGATFDDAAVAAAVMLQKDGAGTDLAGVGQVTINGALKVITINPASALAPGSYTVKLLANQVEDEQGNAITTEQSAVFEVDTAAPTVTFTPADGDKTGNQDVNVKVEFNEAVRQVGGDPITDSNAHLLVMLQKDGTGTDLAGVGQVTINGALKVITINPASALAPGSYTVKLLANQVEDEQGNAITTEQSAVFEVDTAAPTVTFTPADGDKTGNQDVNVKVEFNEAVRQVGGDPITDSNAHLLVMLQKDGTGTDLAGVGQVTINGALKVITINPASALAPGSYTVKLLANQVEDEQGNAITTEQSAVFEVDTAAPTVTFTPADGDKTGNQDVNVKVEFNEAVRQVGGDPITDSNAHLLVMLQKDGTGTDLAGVGQVTINGALKVITINPASALAPGSYTVKLLANQVEDEQGNAITTEQSAVFEVDTAAPTVTFSPADGDKTGNQDVNVKVEFNEAVRQVGGDPITDSNAHLLVMLQKDGTGTDLAGVGQVTINGALKVITINPASALAPGSYTVKLLANQVEDEQGNAITTEQSAVFEVDTAAPTVTFSPADGDKTGNQDVNVKVEFNEAVRQVGGDPITDSNAHLLVMLQKDGTGTDLAGVGQVTINGALKVITINPASALAPGSYTVKLLANQVEDEQGNAITTEQSAVFEVDTAAPTVTFSPADGDKTGNQDVNVKVEFNEAVRQVGGDPITDSNAHLLVMLQKDGTGTDLAGVGQVTINGALKVITINPASALAPGSYTVKLLANQVEDEQGNAITTEQSAVFEVDTAAPTVTFTPADGDKTGNQDVNVKVEFNEAVRQVGGDPITDSNAHLLVMLQKDGTGTDLAGVGQVTINGALKVITINPASALAPGSYTVKLLANQVEDEQGNAITTEQSAVFEVDTAAPTVTFTPADGDKTGNQDVNVKVEFNEAVRQVGGATFDDAAVAAAVMLQKDGAGTDLAGVGQVTINGALKVITINPASALAPGSYTVKLLANQVEDEQGNAITTEQSAVFEVDTALPVVTFSPADGDKTGNQDVNVKVRFSEAVRKANGDPITDSNAHELVTLQKDGTGTDLAGVGQVTINGALKVITINPASALAPGSYTVKLLANQVEDEQGNAITTEQSAVFEVDTAAPTVTFTPADGDKTGNQDVNVKVEFNEAVRQVGGDPITDSNAHLLVMLQKDGTGTDLAGVGQVTINGALKVITINPASALAPGSYTVKLLANQVEDEQGNAITTEQSAVFEVDTALPVVTFSPADGDKTGNQDVNVKVEFNEAVRQVGGDPITDSNAHLLVMLQKDGTGTDLAGVGQVTINGALKVITINPASALAPGSYTVKLLANQVEDEQGNAITTEQSAVFEVDTAAPTVTFTPADGDKTGNQDVNVKVEFNEAVRQVGGATFDDAAVAAAVMLQKDGAGTDLAGVGQVTINGALKVITINPASALAPGSYTVKLLANQVEDEQGNAITTEQSAVFEVDTALPVVTFSPADGDKTGNQDVNVKVRFSEAVRKANGDPITDSNAHELVTLQKDGTGTDLAGVGQVTINGALKVITINPASALAPGSYTVKLLANQVEDEQGNAITTEQSAVFEVDTAAPTVTFTPADGDKTGNQDVNVKVEFNEAVRQVGGDPITDSNAHLLVMLQKDGTGTDLAGVGQVTINGALKVITINPASALAPGSYTVKLLANQVEDEQGNAITTEQSAVFEVDTAAPTVTFTPADGDKTGNQDVNVKVEFNEAVRQVGGDPITDSNAHLLVMLQKDGTGTDLAGVGQVTINGALKVITINPASALAPGSYTVKLLANQVEDEQGNAITTEQSAVFEVDTAAPTVTFTPADGDKTGNQDVNVKVEFNEAVRQVGGDPITDSNAHLLVMLQKDGTGTDLAGVGQVTINGALKVITINPASALAPGSYTVKLLANQVEDEQGNAITTEQSAVFEVDTALPVVTFSPADGDKTGNQDVNVEVRFSEAVRKVGGGAITNPNAHDLVTLQKDGTGTDLAISGQVSINNALKVITINPASSLVPGRYTVTLLANQVEDDAGNAVAATSATFTVGAAVAKKIVIETTTGEESDTDYVVSTGALEVTVKVKVKRGTPAGIMLTLPKDIPRDLEITLSPSKPDVPLNAAGYDFGTNEQDRTVVDVFSTGTLAHLCLPVSPALRAEAGDQSLVLLHHADGAWKEETSYTQADRTRVCADDVTEFSSFAAAYKTGAGKDANQAPAFERDRYAFGLAENRAGPMKLGTVTTANAGDTIAYGITAGDEDRFAIDAASGVVTYTGPGEDHETEPNVYDLTVRVTDDGGLSATAAVIVEILDVNEAPAFERDLYAFGLAENRIGPVELGKLTATDPDAGDPIAYGITAGDESRFAIDAASGVVTYTGPGEDYETKPNIYELTVSATDDGGLSATAAVIVEILDINEAPAFERERYEFELEENRIGPVELGTLTATDPDAGEPVVYALSGNGEELFEMDTTSGVLTYTGPGEDYETEPNVYELTVSATDDEGLSAGAGVTVTVTDEADATAQARLRRVNQAILPELSRTMVAGVVESVAERIEGAGPHAPAPGNGYSVAGHSGIGEALIANEEALNEGSMDWKRALAGSSFALRLGGGETLMDSLPGQATIWGEGDWRELEVGGETGPVKFEGDVRGARLGLDARLRDDLLAGVALSWTQGSFDYTDRGEAGYRPTAGRHESRMTSVYPYVGWWPRPDVGLWGTVGYGEGEVEIDDEEAGAQSSDSALRAAALGGQVRLFSDDDLIQGGTTALTLKGEAWAGRFDLKDDGGRMRGMEVDVRRLRLGLEGEHARRLVDGSTLTPSLELGLRHDDGDGEVGRGVELGGGLTWSDPARGLTAGIHGRTLLAHHGDLEEWGVSGQVTFGPGADDRGLSFSLEPSWGEAQSGLARLWEDGAAANDSFAGDVGTAMRLDAEIGYGLPAFGGHGVLTPYSGLALSDGGNRTWRLGQRLEIGPSLAVDLEVKRRESANDAPDHSLMLRATARW